MADCHSTRRHYGHGLCRKCWGRARRKSPTEIRKHAVCHPDRRHRAKGLCSTCYYQKKSTRERAELSEYHKNYKWRRRQYYLRYWKKYNADPNNKVRRINSRFKKLGVKAFDFEAMLKTQDGQCAICRRVPTRTLDIDHDHATNVVRGLLCNRCNRLLGIARDDRELLRIAALYLERTTSAVEVQA